jgi:AMIN domain
VRLTRLVPTKVCPPGDKKPFVAGLGAAVGDSLISIVRPPSSAVLGWILAAAVLLIHAPELRAQKQAALRAIAVQSRGSVAVVTIAGTGALPEPTAGTATGPPRIYFDFPNVVPGTVAPAASLDSKVRRVRVAIYKSNPVTTRIVIDLTAPQPYRLERTRDGFNVIVGEGSPGSPAPSSTPATSPAATPPAPATAAPLPPRVSATAPPPAIKPVPSLPDPPVMPSAPVSAPDDPARPNVPVASPAQIVVPSQPAPPQKDLERFRRQVSGTLERLRLQQPLLKSLDANEDQTVERMQMAAEEFERLRQEFVAIKPPDTLRAQHAMLVQSSTLAIMATTLQMESMRVGSATIKRNAASAAAGAILLLDRACGDIGCPSVER